MQLDIFDDSRDLMLRNDVIHALLQRDPPAADATWHVLAQAFPQEPSLAPLQRLTAALALPLQPPFADHAAARAARIELADGLAPAAQSMFGPADATAWLRPAWRDLAGRAAPLAFHADHPEDHAAPLWLDAGDAAAAVEAVAGIESWRRIPAPLAWMAEARHRVDGLEAAWPLLAELAWLAPARFDLVSRHLADPALDKLRKAFDASFDGVGQPADLAWFPAWVLTDKPGLARWLGLAQASLNTPAEQGMRRLIDLLTLEQQGRHHELIERRKQLRQAQPALYAAYMRTR